MWCFEYPDLDIDIKNYFYQIFTTCSAQIGRKTKSAQDLLKFGTFDISNMPISILMSKMIFIESLQPVRPKLTPKLKMLRIYWNLAHVIFRISRSRFWCQKLFFYQIFTSCYSQIGPKLKNAQNLLRFGRADISNLPISVLMSIMIFIKYLPPVRFKLVQN